MRRLLCVQIVACTLLGPALPATAQQPRSAPAVTTATTPVQLPPGPREPAQLEREHLEKLQRTVRSAGNPLEAAAANLALANWLIAVPPARPATRWLMGLDTASDRDLLVTQAVSARLALKAAEATIRSQTGDPKRLRELRMVARTLAPFIELFAAAKSAEPATSTRTALGEAALDLANARESDIPAVASAAMLWQAFAWHLAGKDDRALGTLPDALKPPKNAPHEFMARLLRCRLVAAGGEHAAALALLIRIHTLCEAWTDDKADTRARERLTAVLANQVGKAWRQRAISGEQQEVVDRSLRDLLDKHFPDSNEPLYVLDAAIPIILEPRADVAPAPGPAASPNASAPASRPVTTSTSQP